LGDKLNIRPAEILDTWSVPELIVTYGQFANADSYKNYKEYQSLSPDARSKIEKRPKEYAVYFRSISEFEE